MLPLKKNLSILAQLGFVGYDQWQVSSNGGNYLVLGRPVPARLASYSQFMQWACKAISFFQSQECRFSLSTTTSIRLRHGQMDARSFSGFRGPSEFRSRSLRRRPASGGTH